MLIENNIVALITLGIGIIAIIFFVLDKFPMETVSIGLLASLIILSLLYPNNDTPNLSQLLSGFANPGLITVIALLVLAEGLVATGALATIAASFRNF